MPRLRPTRSTPSQHRVAVALVAAGIAAGGVCSFSSVASASGLSTTISRWSSADLTLNDAARTKVTVAAGIDEVGVVGRSLAKTRTISVTLDQSTCKVVSGKDVLVSRNLAVETATPTGVEVNPLLGSASIKATVAATGTETRTPAGTGGDCNEPNAAAATTSPITDTIRLDVAWKNKPGSTPLAWSDVYQQGVFYYRDAVGSGTVKSASTGDARATGSANGWLWSGAWVYATGT